MLFLGLGTGLGSALVVRGHIVPMESVTLPSMERPSKSNSGTADSRRRAGRSGGGVSRRPRRVNLRACCRRCRARRRKRQEAKRVAARMSNGRQLQRLHRWVGMWEDEETRGSEDPRLVERAPPATALTSRQTWKALDADVRTIRGVHLRTLFADDPARGERMTAEGAGLFLDYSKNRATDETMRLLGQLAEESGLRARIDAMFRGEKINTTENRAVLHVALRAPRGASIVVDGRNVSGRALGARKDGRFRRPRTKRRMERPYRQAHQERHQHRHRRLGPRARHGV